jgi:hypothetical protein
VDQQKARAFYDQIQRVRRVDRELGVQTLAFFLQAALNPGDNIQDIGVKADIVGPNTAKSTSSNNYHYLASEKAGGLGLVEARSDPHDLRRKQVWLTPKGQALLNELFPNSSGG